MRVDTMRAIDRRVGVPLCFLLTLLFKLAALFRPRRPAAPKRVLLIELSEMGSAILVDPAMRKIKAQGAELYFAIFAKNAVSLRLLGTVPRENVFTIRENGLVPLVVDTLRFLRWTRAQNIDTVIDLELFSRYTALLTGLSGAPNRIGYHRFHNEGLYRGELLTRRVAYNPHIHIAKNFVALVNAAFAEREELPFSKTLIGDEEIRLAQVRFEDSQLAPMRERIARQYPGYDAAHHRVVLINPNASELLPQRRWPGERYVDLMRRILAAHADVLVLITGAPAERDEAQGLKMRVDSERCINFAGEVKFEELPLLYSVAALMVTNDSGPGHFSSITPLRTFVLFGPETPRLYGSLGNSTPIFAGLACAPCVSASNHRKTPCHEPACMTAITVDQVYGEVSAALG